MEKVKTGKFLGWYFPEENEVPFFLKNLSFQQKKYQCGNCYYESDRARNVRRHAEKIHALPNTNHIVTDNTSAFPTNINAPNLNHNEGGVYPDKRKQTELRKVKSIDSGINLGVDALHGIKQKPKSRVKSKKLNDISDNYLNRASKEI